MRAFLAVLALVWTLLLGAITVQLYQINQHFSWVSGPIRSLAESGRASAVARADETREQRIERKARERAELIDEQVEISRRVLEAKPRGKSATAQSSQK